MHPSTPPNFFYNSSVLILLGTPSISITIEVLNNGIVVNITKIEKKNVHKGSAILYLSPPKYINKAANITPID